MKDKDPIAWKCPLCGRDCAPIFVNRQARSIETKVEDGDILVDREELLHTPPTECALLKCVICGIKVAATGYAVSYV